jgi:hypothetical protein
MHGSFFKLLPPRLGQLASQHEGLSLAVSPAGQSQQMALLRISHPGPPKA